MSVLIVAPGKDVSDWTEELKNQHPGLNVYVYPEDHDKEEVEFAVSWKHPRGLFKNYPNLKVVASMGAGVDHITSDPEFPEDVKITRVIDNQLTSDLSEFVLALVMNQTRHLAAYKHQETEHKWNLLKYCRNSDMKIGVMGMGVIGTAVATLLAKNNFKVSGWSRTEKNCEDITSYSGDCELNNFLKQSEILICLLPLTKQTKGILNTELFEQLPKGAYVINVGRGEHLEESDLIGMIDSGHLAGAFLDVFKEEPLPEDHAFWDHKRISVTPHTASITQPKSVVPQIIENYKRLQNGEPLKNLVEKERGY
ncbi:2-hydroxyacid dehydrogenase [Zunongwangia sp.]|uniref:2-hydroxyacid dehydrogenase n=1 Tax=Zunongwangia sp. TaxID=1965325 RepID=UPI003AA9A12F